MVVGCQPHAPAAFTPKDIPVTHFHEGLSRPQGHCLVGRKYVTTRPGIDPGTVRLVAQRLNHYANPVLYEGLHKNSGNLNSAQTTSKGTVETRSYGYKLFRVKFLEFLGSSSYRWSKQMTANHNKIVITSI
jgi:hypothetical protein